MLILQIGLIFDCDPNEQSQKSIFLNHKCGLILVHFKNNAYFCEKCT